MRKFIFLISILISASLAKAEVALQRFDKAAFYAAMSGTEIDAINNELDLVKDAPEKERAGYEGALLMKKASLVKKTKDKLSFF